MEKNYREEIESMVKETKFSGVVSVKEKGKIVYEGAFGDADRANQRPNNTKTKFGIASGTKFFTALAIGKLIEEGKLSLDSKALDYVDFDFPLYDKEMTVKDLLTHTSGMPDYFDEDEVEDFDNFQVGKPWYEMFDASDYYEVFPQVEMESKPGEVFKYNNGGFIMLAGIVAKASGMRFVEYVSEILVQVKMTNSGFFRLDQLPGNTAIGYVELEEGYRSNVFGLPIIGCGDGGMFTTLDDMYIFWEALYNGDIISKELVELFIEPFIKESDEEDEQTYYGHGVWMYAPDKKRQELYIEGCDAGVSFRSGLIHDKDIVYTVISNTTEGAWDIVGCILERG